MSEHKAYDYGAAVIADVKAFIEKNNVDVSHVDDDFIKVYGDLINILTFCDDVTGGESDAYFKDEWDAEEAVAHNLDLLFEAILNNDWDVAEELRQGAQHCDVLMRQYVLAGAIINVLNEFKTPKHTDKLSECIKKYGYSRKINRFHDYEVIRGNGEVVWENDVVYIVAFDTLWAADPEELYENRSHEGFTKN